MSPSSPNAACSHPVKLKGWNCSPAKSSSRNIPSTCCRALSGSCKASSTQKTSRSMSPARPSNHHALSARSRWSSPGVLSAIWKRFRPKNQRNMPNSGKHLASSSKKASLRTKKIMRNSNLYWYSIPSNTRMNGSLYSNISMKCKKGRRRSTSCWAKMSHLCAVRLTSRLLKRKKWMCC